MEIDTTAPTHHIKKQIENFFLFDRNYKIGIIEHYSKNLKLLDEKFVEKKTMIFGECVLHHILHYFKNEETMFLIALRSDSTIFFYNALNPDIFCFISLPEYQNNLFFYSK